MIRTLRMCFRIFFLFEKRLYMIVRRKSIAQIISSARSIIFGKLLLLLFFSIKCTPQTAINDIAMEMF